jgi:hypothetical protein
MKNQTTNIILIVVGILLTILIFTQYNEPIETVQSGEYEVEVLFEVDGCTMYRFWDYNKNVYFSKCSDGSSTSIYNQTTKYTK